MIDVVCSQPRSTDFPWWRHTMAKVRPLFGKLIITMTNKATNVDVSQTIMKTIPDVTLTDMEFVGDKDWRDIAINNALNLSNADKVLFLEQDFLFDPVSLESVLNNPARAIFRFQEGRIHPCFMLVSRELIDKSSRDFSARPPLYDHFGKFSSEIRDFGAWITITNPKSGLGDIAMRHLHLNGLTQNYTVAMEHPEQVHMPNLFFTYNRECLKTYDDINPDFKPLMEAIDRLVPADFTPDPDVLYYFR